ncbi:hypothetical protein [Polyangium spumosum]|uniref:Uncharacterized protein n=1 Tax=Polyangium spumosum TaxID=889282 RepID=A0A6N7PGH7_9BACT|nr:hypothetical protein [Polyangium spumosum]MRG91128.1 hypothetical protein [Polyangium spumosum]
MLRPRSNWGIFLVSAFLVATLPAACGSEVEGGGNGGAGGGSGGGGAGGAPQFGACTGPGQCTLAPNTCCACGEPTLADVEPVHADLADDYVSSMCPAELPPCPPCAPLPNPDLFAYCEAGGCAAADVTQHGFSECTTAADCRLRLGMGCCEPCAGDGAGLVAIAASATSAVYELLCPPDTGCPACAPVYPTEWKADCVAGHCAVVPAMP